MPELPEVETTRRGLVPVLEGHRIAQAVAHRHDLRWPLPRNFATRLTGRQIEKLERRGKYLLAALDDDVTLIAHLGMTGRFLVTRPGHLTNQPEIGSGPHDHVVLEMEDAEGQPGMRVVFRDPRRFGIMDLVPTRRRDAHPLLRNLGPEPLAPMFDAAWLQTHLAGRKGPIKNLLLDQSLVVGIGNIYASEALHRARISPRRAGGRIAAARLDTLVDSIRSVLLDAIAAGGSTLRDFHGTEGEIGYFQHSFAVYGRDGQTCLRAGCEGTIRKGVQAGRSTYACPACQR